MKLMSTGTKLLSDFGRATRSRLLFCQDRPDRWFFWHIRADSMYEEYDGQSASILAAGRSSYPSWSFPPYRRFASLPASSSGSSAVHSNDSSPRSRQWYQPDLIHEW